MNRFSRLILGLMVFAVGLTLSGVVSAQTALETIQKNRLIKIAIPVDFPPYGFVGTDLDRKSVV